MFKTFGRTRVACDILVAYSNVFIWSNFPTNKKSFDSPENYQNAIDFDCIASETTRKKKQQKMNTFECRHEKALFFLLDNSRN